MGSPLFSTKPTDFENFCYQPKLQKVFFMVPCYTQHHDLPVCFQPLPKPTKIIETVSQVSMEPMSITQTPKKREVKMIEKAHQQEQQEQQLLKMTTKPEEKQQSSFIQDTTADFSASPTS